MTEEAFEPDAVYALYKEHTYMQLAVMTMAFVIRAESAMAESAMSDDLAKVLMDFGDRAKAILMEEIVKRQIDATQDEP